MLGKEYTCTWKNVKTNAVYTVYIDITLYIYIDIYIHWLIGKFPILKSNNIAHVFGVQEQHISYSIGSLDKQIAHYNVNGWYATNNHTIWYVITLHTIYMYCNYIYILIDIII